MPGKGLEGSSKTRPPKGSHTWETSHQGLLDSEMKRLQIPGAEPHQRFGPSCPFRCVQALPSTISEFPRVGTPDNLNYVASSVLLLVLGTGDSPASSFRFLNYWRGVAGADWLQIPPSRLGRIKVGGGRTWTLSLAMSPRTQPEVRG